MQIILIKKEKLYKYPFPNNYVTSFWINDKDEYGNDRELIMMEKTGDKWSLVSNDSCKIINNNLEAPKVEIVLNQFYLLKIYTKNAPLNALIYACNENDASYTSYQVTTDGDYMIGTSSSANIILSGGNISEEHAILSRRDGKFFIRSNDENIGVYVNNFKENNKILENGDVIFIMGYKIIVLNDYLIVNGFINGVGINSSNIVKRELPNYTSELVKTVDDDNAEIYSENDYFSRSPRFVTSIIEENVKIDSPPGKSEPDSTPVIYTIGPMLTMAMSSVVSASTSIMTALNGNGTIVTVLPTAVVSVAMLTSTILWPTLMRNYGKKRQKQQEELRQKKYIEYLIEKRNKIEQLRINQIQVLTENFPDPKNLETIILNKRRSLWERQIDDEDFLSVRLGLGTIPLKINLSYAIEDFSMTSDNLKTELAKIGESAKDIQNAPVTISLTERNKLVIIGDKYYKESMLKSIVLQLATFHSYNDLKIVLMVNEDNTELWEDIKILPHMWSNSRDIRFYGDNFEDMTKISFFLEQVYMSRKFADENGKRVELNLSYKNVSPYYLIIVDNIKKNKNVEIIDKVLKEENNIGFGIIVLNDGISNLPNEINNFLTAAGDKSAIIKNDLNVNNQQVFNMDNTDNIDLPLMCEKLSNIPIKLPLELDEQKTSISFLEMYKVGRVEQLNLLDRWQKNNPVNSLSVPIGIHSDGELFNLDLHEKFHGPHGLIAGMTGSGKSEFIITYILSMCLNFSPEEVSFVLIDYKGGGLTGAFENKQTGMKIPHLAGTITNLDTAEIKRSLASIESELKRRQALFNKAKIELNESTLDIYKYQKLHRDGRIKEPISHLFIISDEFAELKSQQPEFMDELISAARIGRSLGVHLILATQKPSGIVDDQIWSNSKFKVCLKVQEKADSMDVIKCPDAAALKQVGRFYLQVGYNDYFAMGQAGYTGAKYIPKDKITKTVDRSVSFINNIGDTTKSIEVEKNKEVNTVSMGEELPNILKYICETAKTQHMEAKKLWLDKIPAEIFVNNLMKKYGYKAQKWSIVPVVGEFDDPGSQRQGLLTIDFNNNGNTLIYGIDGKEIMLSSIIYSLIITHGPDEINFYIIDFGTEMFGMFKSAPQVGDIVFISETEKLTNLFNTISRELDRRKKLLVDYNGDYNLYIKSGQTDLPRIVVIINNYEVFTETYEDFIETISVLSREGERYGISFVITATGVNAVRGKTSQNFSNQLCLQFNSPSDYTSILGSTHGMVPSSILGRGLIKKEGNLYEFQTAYPCKWDEINSFIKNICFKLNEVIKQEAKRIAVLPNHVRLDNVAKSITDISRVPIGIEKNTLQVSTFDFNKNKISLVASQDNSILDKFVTSLCEVIQNINNVNLVVIDSDEIIKDKSKFNTYYSVESLDAVNKIEELSKVNDNKINMIVINGFETLKSALSTGDANRLKQLMLDIKSNNNMRVIIADSVSKIKTIEYEDFYRTNVQAINAIWVGSGITEQFTIKSSTYNKETRAQIPNDFGYNVKRGVCTFVKLLDFYTND